MTTVVKRVPLDNIKYYRSVGPNHQLINDILGVQVKAAACVFALVADGKRLLRQKEEFRVRLRTSPPPPPGAECASASADPLHTPRSSDANAPQTCLVT